MTDRLRIDIETRSAIDLKRAGVYRYVEDPTFSILMAGWSLNGGPVTVETDPEAVWDIPGLWDPEVVKVAHNAGFERVCFSRFGWQRNPARRWPRFLMAEEWHDTMARAAELGYPLGLDKLARALGVETKDSAGTHLINFFCKPNRRGEWNRPEDHPEKWEAFKAYCAQDVVTLGQVDDALGHDMSPRERRVWLADQAVNDRGIRVDTDLARAAMVAAEDNQQDQELEVIRLTRGTVVNPGSRDQLLTWLEREGNPLPNLTAETVAAEVDRLEDGPVRQVLALRQELALSAAKKYVSALERVSADGRLRGSFFYHGAHTGRWAGRGVQLQNLPAAQLPTEAAVEEAIVDLKLGEPADAYTLKALVRAMFRGPFTVVDYAAIEARVVAWLAGEEWSLEAFRAGRDIYVETAARMGLYATPPDRLDPASDEYRAGRKKGKVAVLALGYNGGVGSLRAMGAEGPDAQLQFLVDAWRAANPAVVDLWAELNTAFWAGGPAGDRLTVEVDGTDRAVVLPSGRRIIYHDVATRWGRDAYGNRRKRLTFMDSKSWTRVDTYGGRLTENVTQAVARDVLADALVRLEAAGVPVVGHVHDEVVVEGRDLERVSALVLEPPEWSDGLPLDGEGSIFRRYRKD